MAWNNYELVMCQYSADGNIDILDILILIILIWNILKIFQNIDFKIVNIDILKMSILIYRNITTLNSDI